jgi:hypothetical protein
MSWQDSDPAGPLFFASRMQIRNSGLRISRKYYGMVIIEESFRPVAFQIVNDLEVHSNKNQNLTIKLTFRTFYFEVAQILLTE